MFMHVQVHRSLPCMCIGSSFPSMHVQVHRSLPCMCRFTVPFHACAGSSFPSMHVQVHHSLPCMHVQVQRSLPSGSLFPSMHVQVYRSLCRFIVLFHACAGSLFVILNMIRRQWQLKQKRRESWNCRWRNSLYVSTIVLSLHSSTKLYDWSAELAYC